MLLTIGIIGVHQITGQKLNKCWQTPMNLMFKLFCILAFLLPNTLLGIELTVNASSSVVMPEESSNYWLVKANNANFSESFRRRCVYCLIRRHLRIGMTLQQIGEILHKPKWLKIGNVKKIGLISGTVPLTEIGLSGEIFCFYVFPEGQVIENYQGGNDILCVFLAFSGQITEEEFRENLFCCQKFPGEAENRLLELGFSGQGFYVPNADKDTPPDVLE